MNTYCARRFLVGFSITIMLTMAVGFASAATIYVDASAVGADDGSSWADAYTDLQSALGAAVSSDEIWVAAATYYPTSGLDQAATFQLATGVAVYGGFDGGETLLTERDWVANVTILSGDIGIPANNTDNSVHVVTGSGTNSTAVLDGFAVTAGNAGASVGGGMLNNLGSPTVANVIFSGNLASSGAGMYNTSASPTLMDVSFVGNTASSDGGGVYTLNSSPAMTNVTFSGNSAFSGGGMFNFNSATRVTNAVFTGNSASAGGGIYSNGNSVKITNASFSNNSASSTGGAMFNLGGSPMMINTIMWGNTAPGGPEIWGGTSTISFSLIEGSGGSGAWDPSFGTDGGNNIDVDPLFVNGPGGDFHLLAASPAMNAGDDSAPNLAATDLDGYMRISGPAVDIGAYEFQCPGPVAYVDSSAVGGDGSSWATAYADLQTAFTAAVQCGGITEIWVAGGTYYPTADGARDSTFQLLDSVAVYGGFAGGETLLSERDWVTNVAILSGDVGVLAVTTDNSYHVVTGSGTNATAVIDGFTVTAGRADGTGSFQNSGAGMLNQTGSPTVTNMIFSNNVQSGGGTLAGGGGMWNNSGSNPTVTNVFFIGNSTIPARGGGMYNRFSNPTLTNVVFFNNAGSVGGGVYCENNSDPTLTNVVFVNNGVAMYNVGANTTPILVNVIVWDNILFSGSGSVPVISNSLIEGSGGSGAGWDPSLGTDGGGNIDKDPLFADEPGGDLRLTPLSPAINAGNNGAPNLPATDLDGNPRILAGAVDMGPYEFNSGLQILAITDIGNDQGRQVNIRFAASTQDAAGSAFPVLQYSVFRRIDQLPANVIALEQGMEEPTKKSSDGPAIQLASVPGWQFVSTLPAFGESEYNVVAATLADSTITAGLHSSVFFIRAGTAVPVEFFDSIPDSGYSLDNLSPAAPANLIFTAPLVLAWDESLDADFNYFSIYGSALPVLDGSATLITNQTTTSIDVTLNPFTFYHVTATDFSGNEGVPAFGDASGLTQAGADVEIDPYDPVTGTSPVSLTFETVTGTGTTTLTTGSTGTPPTANFLLGTPPIYYELTTTATFSGAVEVCIDYSSMDFVDEANLKILHEEGTIWQDRTTSLDTVNKIICGSVTSFSAFIVVEPNPVVTGITPVLRFGLEQNYPNPFNPTTTFAFSIEREQSVSLSVYDISGRLVRTLVERDIAAGRHAEVWDGRDNAGNPVASGVYLYRLKAGQRVVTKKAVLLK